MTLLVICLRGSQARLLPRRATRERCEYARVARGEGKPTRQMPPERVTRYEERSGLSCVGDVFLAVDARRYFLHALWVFLLAHLACILGLTTSCRLMLSCGPSSR